MKINLNSKNLKLAVSIILIVVSYGFIIQKLIHFDKLHDLTLKNIFPSNRLFLFLAALLFMPLNWFIETFKWQFIVKKIQNINFGFALKAVFAGITLGIFTPNRIGEIAGRVLFLDKGKRTFGLFASGLCSFAQFITTIITGLIGFGVLLMFFPEKTSASSLFDHISFYLIILILIILILIYFNVKKLKPLILKFPFFQNKSDQLHYFSEIKFSDMLYLLILSSARYLVFFTQFYFLLVYYDIQISILESYVSISLMFLCTTLIPTNTLAELGIRGSFSIFFIGMFSSNVLQIVLAAFVLWFINIAFPSVLGSIFFINRRFK